MTRAGVYVPDRHGRSAVRQGCEGRGGPGRLEEVELDVLEIGSAQLVLPEATVRDERGGALFTDDGLVFDPSAGGGPPAGASADRAARAFGVVNAAFHTQRALRYVNELLGHPLPRLVVRIGLHEQPRRWSGGHYRLPGTGVGADPDTVSPAGEVHLGGGAGFVRTSDTDLYFRAPAHNSAIVCHEVGHHVGRHTADFRLNRLRPPGQQTNKKTALDEGTADVIAAMLLGTPDIYGWQRHSIPPTAQRRRKLDHRWTMAHFVGGPHSDPHADGTVWASACWSARERVTDTGADPTRFDALLLRGLELVGADSPAELTGDALRERRHFSRLMAAMAEADPDVAPHVLAAMAEHGIHLGISNNDLSRAARTDRGRRGDADEKRLVPLVRERSPTPDPNPRGRSEPGSSSDPGSRRSRTAPAAVAVPLPPPARIDRIPVVQHMTVGAGPETSEVPPMPVTTSLNSVVQLAADSRRSWWSTEEHAVKAALVDHYGADVAGEALTPPPDLAALRARLRDAAPRLTALADRVRSAFDDGAACAVMVPELGLAELAVDDQRKGVFALAVLLGDPTANIPFDRVLWDVQNRGDSSSSHTSFSENDLEADYHTDSASLPVPERFFLLYAVQAARCGGGVSLIRDGRVVRRQLEETPKGRRAVRLLAERELPRRIPEAFKKYADVGPDGYLYAPVIAAKPMWRWRKDAIRKGIAAHPEYQTPEVHDALDTVIEQLAHGPGEIRQVIPTDGILIIDNHVSLHGRTAFTDPHRHLLRLRFHEPAARAG